MLNILPTTTRQQQQATQPGSTAAVAAGQKSLETYPLGMLHHQRQHHLIIAAAAGTRPQGPVLVTGGLRSLKTKAPLPAEADAARA
jgi:hypothetical protein